MYQYKLKIIQKHSRKEYHDNRCMYKAKNERCQCDKRCCVAFYKALLDTGCRLIIILTGITYLT
jgi:hypothetical protein